MKVCPNHILLVISANTDIPSKVHMSAEGLNFSYSKNLSNGTTEIGIYTDNMCGVYESEERLIVISGLFKDSVEDYTNKHIDEILAFFDHLGFMVLVDKKSLDIFIVQGPVLYRPIFYTLRNGAFLASNDLGTIVEILEGTYGEKPPIDLLTLYEHILLGEIVSTHTIVKGVKQVRAGEYVHIRIKDELILEHNRYWKPWSIVQAHNSDYSRIYRIRHDIIHELITIIKSYCDVSSKDVGLPLSGGLDSSIILALSLKKCRDKTIIPIHVNLGKKNELKLSKFVCTYNNIRCIYVVYSIIDLFKNYFSILHKHLCCVQSIPGEAGPDASLLAEALNSNGLKFAMVGDDGDRLWGGYDSYIYYGLQLVLEGKLGKFLHFIRAIRRQGEISLVKVIVGMTTTYVKLKFPSLYFGRRIKEKIKLNRGNKKFYKLLIQYISTLYEQTLKPSSKNIFKEYIARGFIFSSATVFSTHAKAFECNNVILMPVFASRKLLETALSMPDELFFIPYGIRSFQRLLLKLLGYPQTIYLQRKSGFSIPSYIANNVQIISKMRMLLEANSTVSKFIRFDKLNASDIAKVFSIVFKYECLTKNRRCKS